MARAKKSTARTTKMTAGTPAPMAKSGKSTPKSRSSAKRSSR